MEPITFGHYELLEKIATGGMAEVFRARMRRPGGVSKIVCLKRIHPSLCADPSFVTMFVEEARLGCTLSHGNIVPVFDYGCIDGYHFLVMDYLVGHDLAEVMARSRIVSSRFPTELALFVIDEVLEGLAYAHGKRDEEGRPLELVHRDISPSNIMISEAGEVKILDFGIARSALRDFKTRTGVVKGKPGYMAPEQAVGGDLDARVDIFACGVMLHEILTGKRPYQVDVDTDHGTAGANPVEDDDPALSALIERALSPVREDRFANASEMSRAINEYFEEEGLRPVAADLTRYVGALFETPAPTRDWSHRTEAFDRHLAALMDEGSGGDILPDAEEGSALAPAGTSPRGPTTEPMAGLSTEQVTRPSRPSSRAARDVTEGRQPERGRRLVALTVGALLVATGVLFVLERRTSTSAGTPTAAELSDVGTPPIVRSEVEVRTRPSGARVKVDGRAVEGVTPLSVTLDVGVHQIEIRRDDYTSVRRRVEAHPGQIVVLDVALVLAPGTLAIDSEPHGAAVKIDGRPRGKTPVEVGELDRERTYLVEVTLDEHEAWEQEVTLDGAPRRALEVPLSRVQAKTLSSGLLSINAHPWAEVQLDGRPWGETPIINRSVRPGRHVVLLSNPARGVKIRRVVNVRPGEESRISVDLTKTQ